MCSRVRYLNVVEYHRLLYQVSGANPGTVRIVTHSATKKPPASGWLF
jgi:hypothetical protein